MSQGFEAVGKHFVECREGSDLEANNRLDGVVGFVDLRLAEELGVAGAENSHGLHGGVVEFPFLLELEENTVELVGDRVGRVRV